MDIVMIGISVENADLALLGSVSFTDTAKLEMLNLLGGLDIAAGVILSTCNRSEMYLSCDAHRAKEAADLYRSFFHLGQEEKIRVLSGKAACRWLFEVCAGLRSLVPGEDQILAQVREAVRFSQSAAAMDKPLHLIFSHALSCARQIRSELRAGERPLSIASLGIKILKEKTALANKAVLVLGAGKMAQLALAYLRDSGARITLACRSMAKIEALREAYPDLCCIAFAHRAQAVRQAEIIVSATSAPHLIVRRDDLDEDRRQFFLDLASPADIDPAVAKMPGKTLIDMDTLKQVSEHNRQERLQLMRKAQDHLEPALCRCEQELARLSMDPAYAGMQARCEEISDQAYAFLIHRLQLNERERHILRKTIRASLFRLMREPFQAMKQLDPQEQEQYTDMLRKLFEGGGRA